MDPLLEPIEGAERREVGGVIVEIVKVGNGRVKRAIYPPGFRWSTHMRPTVRASTACTPTSASSRAAASRASTTDGCTFDFVAPQVVTIEPGHDAWVVGDEEAVLIQFDSEEGTARRFGLPSEHSH